MMARGDSFGKNINFRLSCLKWTITRVKDNANVQKNFVLLSHIFIIYTRFLHVKWCIYGDR